MNEDILSVCKGVAATVDTVDIGQDPNVRRRCLLRQQIAFHMAYHQQGWGASRLEAAKVILNPNSWSTANKFCIRRDTGLPIRCQHVGVADKGPASDSTLLLPFQFISTAPVRIFTVISYSAYLA